MKHVRRVLQFLRGVFPYLCFLISIIYQHVAVTDAGFNVVHAWRAVVFLLMGIFSLMINTWVLRDQPSSAKPNLSYNPPDYYYRSGDH